MKKGNNRDNFIKDMIILFCYGCLFIVIATFILSMFTGTTEAVEPEEITYNDFCKMVENNEIEEVVIDYSSQETAFTKKDGTECVVANPRYSNFKHDLLKAGVVVNEESSSDFAWVTKLITISLYGCIFLYMYKITKGNTGDILKNKTEISNVKMSDVAGLEEVKEDVMTIISFLSNPLEYQLAGAKLPKGVLFYGPPGTGKTLLAKAIAGEAKANFISVNGADFSDKYVGVAADRVRKLFDYARKNAPCIVFIDEIDALGGNRMDGKLDSERHNTLNALLSEMDGFKSGEGVVVIAATNRIEDLDAALIRPGRFDNHFAVPLPVTTEDRKAIIDIYAKGKNFDESVNLDNLAKETLGCSPADIEVILNEAAIEAVKRKSMVISKNDIESAFFKKIMKGHARKKNDRKEDEIKLTAWHEAGHALLGILTHQEVTKVTIIPSTSGAGGVTMFNNTKMGMYSKEELLDHIRMTYAGRAAEKLLVGEDKVTTGASADITQATDIITSMISKYGMSKFGMVDLQKLDIDKNLVFNEVTRVANAMYLETEQILKNNADVLEIIANELISRETLTGDEVTKLYDKARKENCLAT